MRKKLTILCLIILYCFILKYMLHVFLPFLLSIICFFMMKPIMNYLENIFHIQRSAIGVSLLLIFYFLIVSVFMIIFIYGMIYCLDFFKNLPIFFQDMIMPFIKECTIWLENQLPFLMNQDNLQIIGEYSQQFLWQIMNYVYHFISSIPQFFLSFFIFVISSFFLVLEYEQIKDKLFQVLPDKFFNAFVYIKNQCFQSIKIYIQCQLILMNICFIVLLFGFMILKIKHFFILALLTAFFDSLPFIGVGIILIPILIYYLLKKAFLKSFYIFLLYLLINLLRSFLEPHIMNKQMKIPSFILLLSMMIHFYLFGVIGIILSPIHMNLIYSFLDYHYL